MNPQDRGAATDASADASDRAAPVDLGMMRAAPAFTIAFALVYFYGVWTNDGWIRFYPNVNEIHFSPQPPDIGVPMFWYGWVVNGLVAGLLAGGAALLAPRGWLDGMWRSWAWVALAVPSALIVWLFWLLRGYFTH